MANKFDEAAERITAEIIEGLISDELEKLREGYSNDYYIKVDGKIGLIDDAVPANGRDILLSALDEEDEFITLDHPNGVLIDGNKLAKFVNELDTTSGAVDIEAYRVPLERRQKILGDCVSANAQAFLWIADGKYPHNAKIPPNTGVYGVEDYSDWHDAVEFKKLVKSAYAWKLIQGTTISAEDGKPMAHSWCEATIEDIKGAWNFFNTTDGRMVFDFTSSRGGLLFLQSVNHFNMINKIPPADNPQVWSGYEWLYKRFEYNPEQFKDLVYKPENMGHWKFYEFDAVEINKHSGRK
jgi:hypothetical protein